MDQNEEEPGIGTHEPHDAQSDLSSSLVSSNSGTLIGEDLQTPNRILPQALSPHNTKLLEVSDSDEKVPSNTIHQIDLPNTSTNSYVPHISVEDGSGFGQASGSTTPLGSQVESRLLVVNEELQRNLNYLLSKQNEALSDMATTKTMVQGWLANDELMLSSLNLKGESAQAIQNALDIVALAETPGSDLESQCQVWMKRIARDTLKLPSSLFVKGITNMTEYPMTGGGFADIYVGTWKGRRVAIKALRVFAPKEEHDIIHKDCYQEALIWKRLDHPHILPFYGIAKDTFERRICLISPWMANGNITKYLAQNKVETPFPLILQVARGLEYLHSRKFNHGDIKAANILIDENGNALLSDMGLTTVSASHAYASSHQTNMAGSTRWMSPELFLTENPRLSYASDVYALGMTIYEVLSGKIPFYELREYAIITHLASGEHPTRPPPHESVFPISDTCWTLLEQCWAQEPTTRPRIQHIISELKEIIKQEGQL